MSATRNITRIMEELILPDLGQLAT